MHQLTEKAKFGQFYLPSKLNQNKDPKRRSIQVNSNLRYSQSSTGQRGYDRQGAYATINHDNSMNSYGGQFLAMGNGLGMQVGTPSFKMQNSMNFSQQLRGAMNLSAVTTAPKSPAELMISINSAKNTSASIAARNSLNYQELGAQIFKNRGSTQNKRYNNNLNFSYENLQRQMSSIDYVDN